MRVITGRQREGVSPNGRGQSTRSEAAGTIRLLQPRASPWRLERAGRAIEYCSSALPPTREQARLALIIAVALLVAFLALSRSCTFSC